MPEPLSLVIQTKSRNVIFNPQMLWTDGRDMRCSLASHDTAYESLGCYYSVQRAFDVNYQYLKLAKMADLPHLQCQGSDQHDN